MTWHWPLSRLIRPQILHPPPRFRILPPVAPTVLLGFVPIRILSVMLAMRGIGLVLRLLSWLAKRRAEDAEEGSAAAQLRQAMEQPILDGLLRRLAAPCDAIARTTADLSGRAPLSSGMVR